MNNLFPRGAIAFVLYSSRRNNLALVLGNSTMSGTPLNSQSYNALIFGLSNDDEAGTVMQKVSDLFHTCLQPFDHNSNAPSPRPSNLLDELMPDEHIGKVIYYPEGRSSERKFVGFITERAGDKFSGFFFQPRDISSKSDSSNVICVPFKNIDTETLTLTNVSIFS